MLKNDEKMYTKKKKKTIKIVENFYSTFRQKIIPMDYFFFSFEKTKTNYFLFNLMIYIIYIRFIIYI